MNTRPISPGLNFLNRRVRRFSYVALIVNITFGISNYVLSYQLASDNSEEYIYKFGLGTAFIIYGVSFILPMKLAKSNTGESQIFISFLVFMVILFSALLWFPLNIALTK